MTRFFSAHAAATSARANVGGEVGVLSVRVCEANDAAEEKHAACEAYIIFREEGVLPRGWGGCAVGRAAVRHTHTHTDAAKTDHVISLRAILLEDGLRAFDGRRRAPWQGKHRKLSSSEPFCARGYTEAHKSVLLIQAERDQGSTQHSVQGPSGRTQG